MHSSFATNNSTLNRSLLTPTYYYQYASKMDERAMYEQLPQMVIFEFPAPFVKALLEQTAEHGENGFLVEDLIDSWLLLTDQTEEAEDKLEGWFDEVCEEAACEVVVPGISAYVSAMVDIAQSLHSQLRGLYTPSGKHYYQFCQWIDTNTVLLTKRAYGDA